MWQYQWVLVGGTNVHYQHAVPGGLPAAEGEDPGMFVLEGEPWGSTLSALRSFLAAQLLPSAPLPPTATPQALLFCDSAVAPHVCSF